MSYTKSQCLDAILAVSSKVDGSLTSTEYRNLCEPKHPSDRTIINKFDTWNEAKEAAGKETFDRGIVKDETNSVKEVNLSYFETIDTPEKAYWLGFIYADGHVSDRFKIQIAIEDEHHLRKFKKDIESEHKLHINEREPNNSIQIEIKRTEFVSNLRDKGLEGDKTYSDTIPDLSDELLRHWTRGVFDGDGSSSSKQKRIRITGSKSRLEKLSKLTFGKVTSRNGFGYFNACGDEAQKFASWMYPKGIDTEPMLERKYRTWM